ncbi:FepA family TonB-dependent siderophore receptor [Paracoccus sp. PARArs4]|uniref:FepA family TonB-dependent siderophore receptor n=1 Tax=Paracoccus sp. PARArs4 TaxID=2853442 RepID=UPI0024A70D48|nr:FepA family TonB-dependent siderophore receptor [Paracoccus sp. PARArs4]
MSPTFRTILTTTALVLLPALPASAQDAEPVMLEGIVLSAEEQALQSLGVSNISQDELERSPVVNDISEIVRKQPGVNLTGATATGQRGNQRQIDIRGMGPENTLILIDGKPVLSRNSVKQSRGGERDTRGDANWVPAELIESIEVIRGPAAARYGSGASGGVVNIITKRPDSFMAELGLHWNQPESGDEGATKRMNLLLAGPISERLGLRLWGNFNKSDADDADINPVIGEGDDTQILAGTEGVVNKDVGASLSWDAAPGHRLDLDATFSRQGNIYAGDTLRGAVLTDAADIDDLIGMETNRVYRRTFALTHEGEYDFGSSTSFIQWENTRNTRFCEGLAGSGEGRITGCVDTDGDDSGDTVADQTIELDTLSAKTEWVLPTTIANRNASVTLGADYRGEWMDDPASIGQGLDDSLVDVTGVPADGDARDTESDQHTIGLYAEANVEWSPALTLTPSIRYDWNDNFGGNVSPGIIADYAVNDSWTVKAGIARAYKTPTLFQLNPNYVYTTRGNGCPVIDGTKVEGPCYMLGNPDLDPEISLNKELGVAYAGADGLEGSLTFFHNDYENRIASGFRQYNPEATSDRLFRWENEGKAVISGIEGNFATPIGTDFAFNANFTHMIKSEKDNGDPLSLVPDYTVNASLDWYARPDVTLRLSATHYGNIEAPDLNPVTNEPYEETRSRGSYTLVDLGATWDVNDRVRLSGGVTNLFDKQILRTGSGGTSETYNEPGRAYYLSLNKRF